MKIGLLFGGQGSQIVGMGKDLYEEFTAVREIMDRLPSEKRELAFEGPMDELSRTTNTQPILLAFGMAVFKELENRGLSASLVGGLSLGEYTALCASGVFDIDEAIELVSYRAKSMEEAATGIECGMAAVMEMDKATLESCCREASSNESIVEITNINCPGQLVISGEKSAVERASNLAKERGARRVVPLNVSGPFHTSYMEPAGKAIRERFKQVEFKDMNIPVLFNCIGRQKKDDESIESLLEKQVSTGVRMEDMIRAMIDEGVDIFIEISPSKTISTFIKKINRDVRIIPITNREDLEKALKELAL